MRFKAKITASIWCGFGSIDPVVEMLRNVAARPRVAGKPIALPDIGAEWGVVRPPMFLRPSSPTYLTETCPLRFRNFAL
jgi:hypothetical protein